MKAIVVREPGGPEVLEYAEVPDPEVGPGEVLVDVAATAVNRADLLQRQGHYHPPPGASEVIGLECSGTVAAVGSDVTGLRVGDEVCALLSGGGYATRVAVPAGQVMPVPAGVDLVTAAALPEVAGTVWSNVMMVAGLRRGRHASWCTAAPAASAPSRSSWPRPSARGCSPPAARPRSWPSVPSWVRTSPSTTATQDFVEVVREVTDGHGADVILDNMGATYLGRNVAALAIEGRLVVIGLQGGTKGELDLGALMRKRAAVVATTLRARPVAEKGTICAAVAEHVWPLVADGDDPPGGGHDDAAGRGRRAHRRMESGAHTGKIVLVA